MQFNYIRTKNGASKMARHHPTIFERRPGMAPTTHAPPASQTSLAYSADHLRMRRFRRLDRPSRREIGVDRSRGAMLPRLLGDQRSDRAPRAPRHHAPRTPGPCHWHSDAGWPHRSDREIHRTSAHTFCPVSPKYSAARRADVKGPGNLSRRSRIAVQYPPTTPPPSTVPSCRWREFVLPGSTPI
jgi:hypothetical protein